VAGAAGADYWVRGARVWSEVGAADVGGEEVVVCHAAGGEIGMVDHIEDFAAEAEFEVFGKIPEFTDGGVPIVEGIATKCVTGQVAVSAGGMGVDAGAVTEVTAAVGVQGGLQAGVTVHGALAGGVKERITRLDEIERLAVLEGYFSGAAEDVPAVVAGVEFAFDAGLRPAPR
jgi:hypothetical protein